jgi:hypothetical protein
MSTSSLDFDEKYKQLEKENRCPICGYFLKDRSCEFHDHWFSLSASRRSIFLRIYINDSIYDVLWVRQRNPFIQRVKSINGSTKRLEIRTMNTYLVPTDQLENRLKIFDLMK